MLGHAAVGALASIRFFEPTERFFDVMEPYGGRQIYDVGAGLGHVTVGLRAAGHLCTAIDVNARDGEVLADVVRANGATFPYAAGSIVLLARPCHGLFPEYVTRQALLRCAAAVVYVGFRKNMRVDLGGFAPRFRSKGVVGRSGERAYVFEL